MNLCVRLGEVFNRLPFILVIILIRDRDKVIALALELIDKVSAMRNTSTENNRLAWAPKNLVRFLNPLLHNVARDLHAACRSLVLTPLASNLLCSRHINGLGNKHTKRRKPLVTH